MFLAFFFKKNKQKKQIKKSPSELSLELEVKCLKIWSKKTRAKFCIPNPQGVLSNSMSVSFIIFFYFCQEKKKDR